MRFSTVAAVSAAVLAGSTVAVPVFASNNDLAARNPGAATGAQPPITPQKTVGNRRTGKKKQGLQDLFAAGKEYKTAEAEYKKAELDLANARMAEKYSLNEMGFGGIDRNFGATSQQAQKPNSAARQGSTTGKRDLNSAVGVIDIFDRDIFEEIDQLFVRDPTAASGAAGGRANGNPSGAKRPGPNQPAGDKPKSSRVGLPDSAKKPVPNTNTPVKPKLTAEQQGQLDLSNARKTYQSAQGEYKKAQLDLSNARTGQRKALEELGFNGIDKNFGSRNPDVHSTSKSSSGAGRPKPNGTPTESQLKSSRVGKPSDVRTNQIPPKPILTTEQQGQLDLSNARKGYQSAQSEYKKAEAELANARLAEQKALDEMGFGGINKNFGSRSLDIEEDLAARDFDVVEELMNIIARGYYDAL